MRFSGKRGVMRVKNLRLFETAFVLVCLDHVARRILNANHNIV
jgi:hypothetical protein